MYHYYPKDSSYLRTAIHKSYGGKCVYCSNVILVRGMHIDHILPKKLPCICDDDVKEYIRELNQDGFIVDSIENYFPTCGGCNTQKNNTIPTSASLRYYHNLAKQHVDSILRIIEKLKNDSVEEYFFEPVDKTVWEELKYDDDNDISQAILGYRLSPMDVKICPKFSQVNKIIKQLDLVPYVLIQGEAGCGKSISLFQAGYELFTNGWHVYLFKGVDHNSTPIIPNNTEKSVFLIDDGHLFSDTILQQICNQAKHNTKVLISKTLGLESGEETIFLNNQESVSTLYSYYQQREKEIFPLIKKCDPSIQDKFYFSEIKMRLEEARKATTPWVFNYIMRGGWNYISDRYHAICNHKNYDFLAALIAVVQILQRDKAIDYDWLCLYIRTIDQSYSWNITDLDQLVHNKIVLSNNDVRIVHIESANRIVSIFLKESDEKRKKVFKSFIESTYMEGKYDPLGVVWLCNGVDRYYDNTVETLVSQKMIDYTLQFIDAIDLSEKRMQIAYFMERFFSAHFDRNGKYYFKKKYKTIIDWISSTDSITAYAYSRLLNSSINCSRDAFKRIVTKIEIKDLFIKMMGEKSPNIYAWAHFFNRLFFSHSSKDIKAIETCIRNSVYHLCSIASVQNIYVISEFLCNVCYQLDITEFIKSLLPVYEAFFLKDHDNIIEIFRFSFLLIVCGLDLLEPKKPTDKQVEMAKMMISIISNESMARLISIRGAGEYDEISPIMWLIKKYDSIRAKQIIKSVDIDILSNSMKDDWEQSSSICRLINLLAEGDLSTVKTFLRKNKRNMKYIYSVIFIYYTDFALELYKDGVPIKLIDENHWWSLTYYALNTLHKKNQAILVEILTMCLPEIIDAINNVTGLDFTESYCLATVKLIKETDDSLFSTLRNRLDIHHISERWDKCGYSPKKKRIVLKRKKEFFSIVT